MFLPPEAKCINNKMQPTNPNAHTYVNGTDVEKHREENLFRIFGPARLCDEDAKCEVKSVKCGAQCRVWSVKCKVSSVECGV